MIIFEIVIYAIPYSYLTQQRPYYKHKEIKAQASYLSVMMVDCNQDMVKKMDC